MMGNKYYKTSLINIYQNLKLYLLLMKEVNPKKSRTPILTSLSIMVTTGSNRKQCSLITLHDTII